MPKAHDSRVVIGGASGLIGRALVASFEADGVQVTRLVRRPAQAPNEVEWQTGNALRPDVLEGASAVFCLNGSSVGSLPWTGKKKRMLTHSRTMPRLDIAQAAAALGDDAPLVIETSGSAIYGSSLSAPVDETSPHGHDFLAEVAASAERAAALTPTPTAHIRLGIVPALDGFLRPLVRVTLMGLAARLGPGTQKWPWISLSDTIRGLRHVHAHRLSGAINFVAPTTATANDVTFAVARELSKPHMFVVPSFALRALLGRGPADHMLLVNAEIVPQVLLDSGFKFTELDIERVIHNALAPLRRDA